MRLLSAKQAAEHFNVHVNTVRMWHKMGVIDAVKVGNGRHRYDVDSVGRNTTGVTNLNLESKDGEENK